MKKKIVRIIVVILVIILGYLILSEYFARNSKGFYRPLTGTIYCKDYSTCIHEIGHKSDDELGWVSKTDEWIYAVDWYRVMIYYYPETRDQLSSDIEFFYGIGWKRFQGTNNIFSDSFWDGWGGYTELYAYILELSDGKKENVPEMFGDFYDWNRINELMNELNLE